MNAVKLQKISVTINSFYDGNFIFQDRTEQASLEGNQDERSDEK